MKFLPEAVHVLAVLLIFWANGASFFLYSVFTKKSVFEIVQKNYGKNLRKNTKRSALRLQRHPWQ